MSKILILSFICVFNNLISQNYYAVRNSGKIPKDFFLDRVYSEGTKALLEDFSNNNFSKTQTIPFEFYFLDEIVNHYKISDNGFITFDTASNHNTFDSSSLPNNSIYAFYQDFKLQQFPPPNVGLGVKIFTYTSGIAPFRTHTIQYFGLSLASDSFKNPTKNSSVYSFSIVLYEGMQGNFDIIYTPYGNTKIKGGIGCQNNRFKYLLNDSFSNLPVQFSFNTQNFIVYEFKKGKQLVDDIELLKLNLNKNYPVNSIVNFSGIIKNNGKRELKSARINYSINNGDTFHQELSSLNLAPNGIGNVSFTHPLSWTSGTAGSLNNVLFWVDAPNNMIDSNFSDNIYKKIVLRNLNNSNIERNILIEEGTGAWCGYCPDAHLLIDSAKKIYGGRLIPITYHFEDSMSNKKGNIVISNYFNSFPDAMIDRTIFLGAKSTWFDEIEARLKIKSPLEIKIIEKDYNSITRKLTFKINIKFVDYYFGNLKLRGMITENNVRGNPYNNLWSQNNYYSSRHGSGGVGGNEHPLFNELEFMHGYKHQFVLKDIIENLSKSDSIFPNYITPNSEYEYLFEYTLPPTFFVKYLIKNNSKYCSTIDKIGENEGFNVAANLNLVASVFEDNGDILNNPILNSVGIKLWDFENKIDKISQINGFSIYPNPTNGILNIENKNKLNFNFEIYNNYGQLVLTQKNIISTINIDFSTLNTGIYSIKITSIKEVFTQKISLIRN